METQRENFIRLSEQEWCWHIFLKDPYDGCVVVVPDEENPILVASKVNQSGILVNQMYSDKE